MTAAKARISKDPEERRLELLEAAGRLFRDLGYEKTSVQAITDDVGVAKGLFYHYFDSKADLLNQLAVWQATLYLDALPMVSEMQGDAVQKLRDFVGRTVQWKFEDLRELTITYLDVLYRDENQPLRAALVTQMGKRLVPLFADIIAEGVQEGACNVADPEITAEMVVALGAGQGDHWAELLRAALVDPEQVEPLIARLHGYETAVERLLGMRPGVLRLYDYDYLRRTFTELAEA
jgi:AcrR family transcriptional regulator